MWADIRDKVMASAIALSILLSGLLIAGGIDRVEAAMLSEEAVENADPTVSLFSPDGGEIYNGGDIELITWNASFNPTPASPIAYWELDEISGATAYDSVGTHDGVINGAIVNQPGQIGTSYFFDGNTDYVGVPHSADIDFNAGEDFSIYAWVMPVLKNNGRIVEKQKNGFPTTDDTGYYMCINSAGAFQAGTHTPVDMTVVAGSTDITGSWHHVGLVRSGDTIEGFVDGASIGTDDNAGGDLRNTNNLYIGTDRTVGWFDYFGYIDDVKIFDRAIRPYNSLDIYYSTDNGANWTLVSSGEVNDGQYSWNVPMENSDQCLVKIVATDTSGNSSFDVSNSTFTIVSSNPAVELNYPNGGEVFGEGQISINWTMYDNAIAQLNMTELYYSVNNGADWILITNNTMNDGEYDWTLPAIGSDQCLIKIVAKNAGGQNVTDVSNATFTIDSVPPAIEVIYPNGGELFLGGSQATIAWNMTENFAITPDTVDIHLSINDGTDWTVVSLNETNDGSFLWNIPVVTSDDCLIRIRATDDVGNLGEDFSDTLFTIDSTPPYVKVLMPNGNEIFKGGQTTFINWTVWDNYAANPNIITIHYSINSGVNWTLIAANELNDGSHLWTTPLITSDDCLVRITANDLAGNVNQDVSDVEFTIDSTPPFVKVDKPNGGEVFQGGTQALINWTVWDNYPMTKTNKLIFYDGFDDGTFNKWQLTSWNPLGVLETTTSISQSPSYSAHVQSYSWQNTGPWFGKFFPTDYERMYAEAYVYLPAKVQSYDDIFLLRMGDGSYSGGTLLSAYNYIIKLGDDDYSIDIAEVYEPAPSEPKVTKDIAFDIYNLNPNTWYRIGLELTPQGYEMWVNGVSVIQGERMRNNSLNFVAFGDVGGSSGVYGDVYYDSIGVYDIPADPIDIYYSINGGADWTLLSEGEVNDATYTWDLPMVSSDQCLVRINATDKAGNMHYDVSDSFFTIESIPPTAWVVSPNGGEVLVGGQQYTISWAAYDNFNLAPDPITLYYSTNNGGDWTMISSGEVNDGSYLWTAPSVNSDQCLIRVVAVDEAGMSTADDSNSTFTIDTAPPTSSVNPISPYWYNSFLTVTATANDASGIASVTLYYSYEGGPWIVYGTKTSPPWTFDFTFPMGEGNYEFYTLAEDNSGIPEDPPVVADASAGYDITAPAASSLSIEPTPSQVGVEDMAWLNATIGDLSGSEITAAEWYLSNGTAPTIPVGTGNNMNVLDGSWNSAQEGVTAAIDVSGWTGSGDYDIWVRGRDAAGNWGPWSMITFTRESGASQLAIIPGSATMTAGTQITFAVQARSGSGTPTNVASDTVVYLYTTSAAGEFRTVGTGTPIIQITILAGTSSVSFDYYDTDAMNDPYVLTANSTGLADGTATVNVDPDVVDTIVVSPDPVDIMVGDSQQFSAEVYDQFGNLIPDAILTWSTDVGSVNSTGYFTAQVTPANGVVTATNGSVNGTAVVNVLIGALDHIVISPDPASMTADDTQQFTAIGYDAFNNPVPISPTWEVNGGGTVNSTGFFTADTVGTWYIYANDSGVSGFAEITITHGVAVSLVVSPFTSTITADDTVTYTATAYDSDGNSWDATALTTFVDNDPIGFMSGNVYYAGQTGTWTINATYGAAEGFANVTVTPGDAALFVLTAPLSVNAYQLFSVTLTVYDIQGNVKTDYTGTVNFSSSDPYPASLPPDYTFDLADGGVKTFNDLSLYTPPSQVLTVTDTAIPSLTDTVSIDVHSPEMVIEKLAVATVFENTEIIYTIYYNNTGDTLAPFVWINDTLPQGVNFVSASDGGILVVDLVQWSFTDVPPGSHFVSLTVQVQTGLGDGWILDNHVFCNYTKTATSPATEVHDNALTEVICIPLMVLDKTVEPIYDDIVVGPDYWGEGSNNSMISYLVNVTNLQPIADSIDMDYVSKLNWPVELFDTGWNPLTDTNGNTFPDTGILPSDGGNFSMWVNLSIPGYAEVGQEEYTYIIGTSFNNANVLDIAKINTTVIAATQVDTILGIFIDNSDSMTGRYNATGASWLTVAKEGAKNLISDLTDGSAVSVFSTQGSNTVQVIGMTTLSVAGRASVNSAIDGISAGQMTPVWDGTGAAYMSVRDSMNDPTHPEWHNHSPAVLSLTDGFDYQSKDSSASGSVESASSIWAPWHTMSPPAYPSTAFPTVVYDWHIGKYAYPYTSYPPGSLWMNATNLGERRGLLYSDIPIYTIGLGLEHYENISTPVRHTMPVDNEFDGINATYDGPGSHESGTSEYNLWKISNTSGASYYYSPDASELIGIFQEIGASFGQGSEPAVGAQGKISAGDALLYKIYYNNTGNGTAADLWVNDTLPANLEYISSNASVPYDLDGSTYSWHFQNVSLGSYWFWIKVEVNTSVQNNDTIDNWIFANYTDSRGIYQPMENSNVSIGVVEPVISLDKIVDKTSALPGEYLNYTIFYNNTGDGMAIHVWVNETFHPALQYVSDTAPVTPLFNGNNYSWDLLAIAPGNYNFTITVFILSGTQIGEFINNTAFVTYANQNILIRPDANDISNTVETAVDSAYIPVKKVVDVPEAGPDDFLNYTIYFNNTGNAIAPDIWINDTLPSNVTYVSDDAPSLAAIFVSSDTAGNPLLYHFSNVNPGNYWFSITVQVDSGATPGTYLVNNVSAEYSDVTGYMMPSRYDDASTLITGVGTINIDLLNGWNFISIPLRLQDESITSVLLSIDGKWDIARFYDSSDNDDRWKSYNVLIPSHADLTEINITMGFWLHTTEACTLTVTGEIPIMHNIILRAGWNMIGYPARDDSTYTVSDLKTDAGATSVEAFNPVAPYLQDVVGDGTLMTKGMAYWVYVPSDSIWIVNW